MADMTSMDADEEFGRQMLLVIAEQAVLDGDLVIEGLTDEQVGEAVHGYMRELADAADHWGEPRMRRDYEETLASEATRHHEAGHFNLAILLHATRVEHWLNRLIAWGLQRRGIHEQDRPQVIREAPLRAKTGWLWQLLFDAPLPDEVVRKITALTDSRNAFVHYKWKDLAIAEFQQHYTDVEALSASCPELLAKLHDIEDQLAFAGKRRALGSVFGVLDGHQSDEPLT